MEKDKELSPEAIENLRKFQEEARIRKKELEKQSPATLEMLIEQSQRLRRNSNKRKQS